MAECYTCMYSVSIAVSCFLRYTQYYILEYGNVVGVYDTMMWKETSFFFSVYSLAHTERTQGHLTKESRRYSEYERRVLLSRILSFARYSRIY